MKLANAFLIFLILFLILICSLWFITPPHAATGMPHPEFKTMLHSGDSIVTSKPALYVSYLFGLAVIVMMYFFVRFGSTREKDTGHLTRWLSIAFFIYILVYTGMFMSYIDYAINGHNRFFLGWPTPTAWMIYAMWATPSIIMLIYIVKFKDWILSDEDEQVFQEILMRRKQRLAE